MPNGQQITNPRGAYGGTVRPAREVDSFKTSAAVAAKAVVAIATDGTYRVATAATNGSASLCVGIVGDTAAASGDQALVVTRGVVKSVPVDGAVSAGDILKRSVTTAGRLAATASPAAGERFAVALAASASNVVDVWVVQAL